MIIRPRRLRTTRAMRSLVAETRVHPAQLVLPVFVADGLTEPAPITSLPGVVQHTLRSVADEARLAVDAGLKGIMLFGVPKPEDKDAYGSIGWAPDGILNRGLSAVRDAVGDDLVVMADTCLDEFTDHGHCGVLDQVGRVDNDATLERYVELAVSQAVAGAHVLPHVTRHPGAFQAQLHRLGAETDSLALQVLGNALPGEKLGPVLPAVLLGQDGMGRPDQGIGGRHGNGRAIDHFHL